MKHVQGDWQELGSFQIISMIALQLRMREEDVMA